MKNIAKKVIEIIKESLKDDCEITEETNLPGLFGYDSLDMEEFGYCIEQKFGIKILDDDLLKLWEEINGENKYTIRELTNWIEPYIEKKVQDEKTRYKPHFLEYTG